MPTFATHTYLPQDSPEILALLSVSQHSGKGSYLPLMFTFLLFPVLLLHHWSQKHTNHTVLFPQRLFAISSGKQLQERVVSATAEEPRAALVPLRRAA